MVPVNLPFQFNPGQCGHSPASPRQQLLVTQRRRSLLLHALEEVLEDDSPTDDVGAEFSI